MFIASNFHDELSIYLVFYWKLLHLIYMMGYHIFRVNVSNLDFIHTIFWIPTELEWFTIGLFEGKCQGKISRYLGRFYGNQAGPLFP